MQDVYAERSLSVSTVAGALGASVAVAVVLAAVAGVALLVVTALLIRTFVNLRSLDPGFDATNVMTARVSLQDVRYDTAAKVNALFDGSLRLLAATPGVEAAAVSLELPYRRLLNSGFAFADEASATRQRVTTPRCSH